MIVKHPNTHVNYFIGRQRTLNQRIRTNSNWVGMVVDERRNNKVDLVSTKSVR